MAAEHVFLLIKVSLSKQKPLHTTETTRIGFTYNI